MANFSKDPLILGKRLSSMTKEEIDETMVKIRSKRKGTNGRLGYRNPDSQLFVTNDFQLENTPKLKFGEHRRKYNEHVKCIFVCARELYSENQSFVERPVYLIGFLSDSNRYSFEEFRDYKGTHVKNIAENDSYRVQKFYHLFKNKNINKNTHVLINMDGIKENHFIYLELKLMTIFAEAHFREIKSFEMIRSLVREYRVYKRKSVYRDCENYDSNRINKVFSEIYDFIVENKICPWICEENKNIIRSMAKYKQHSFTLLHLGLLLALIRKYNLMLKQTSEINAV